MPFAGELIQVRDDERDWEGAAERLLRGFGLSLLVPDEHYARWPTGWTARICAGRLVYFRVRAAQDAQRAARPASATRWCASSSIKPDSPFYDWLERELAHRFDVACCATQEQFRRETRAITRAGQIKAPGERHEKDDRHRIDDRSRYVLGWSNAAKIAALEAKAQRLEAQSGRDWAAASARLQQERRHAASERLEALAKLEEFTRFRRTRLAAAGAPRSRGCRKRSARLEAASDVLQDAERAAAGGAGGTGRDRSAELEKTGEQARPRPSSEAATPQALRAQTQARWLRRRGLATRPSTSALERLRAEALGEHQLTVESCDNREQDMRDWLQDAHRRRRQASSARLAEKIIKAMAGFKEAFKLETAEVDASLEAAFEYRAMLDTAAAPTTCRASRRASRSCSTSTPSTRSPTSTRNWPASARRSRSASPASTSR